MKNLTLFLFIFYLVFILQSCRRINLPSLETSSISDLSDTSVTCGGTVYDDGGSTVMARGICYDAYPNPDLFSYHTIDGNGTGSFTSKIVGLVSGETYWLRAYATNEAGTAYGDTVRIKTFGKPISIGATEIGMSSVRLYGIFCPHNQLYTEIYFDLGTSVNYSKAFQASIGTIPGFFVPEPWEMSNILITDLKESTVYHYRVRATSSQSSTLGNDLFFRTFNSEIVEDIDGNQYNTITIGTQTWLSQNLKTTRLNDGSSLPNVTDNAEWIKLKFPAYCWYNNDQTSYKNMLGALYNWYSINTGKLCPVGWHIPTLKEWETLLNEVGGQSEAAMNLKEVYYRGNNSSGFSAIPAGTRYYFDNPFEGAPNPDGTIPSYGCSGHYWSSSITLFEGNEFPLKIGFYDRSTLIYMWVDGYSAGNCVRCIKD
jgi:uncharacterized protein (TIGR02145 family)